MNTICHWELQTKDHKRAKSFYEALFGWKLEYISEMNYMMVDTGGQPGGGINIVDTMKPSGTVLYVEVEDIEAKLAKASQLGGKVTAPKTAIPGIGFFGMFEDPDGNTMGVFTGK